MKRFTTVSAAALSLALMLAACQGGGGNGQSQQPTPAATEAAATQAPADSGPPPAESQEPATGDFPNEDEAALLEHIPEEFRDECSRSDFGASGTATIGCGIQAAGGDVSITYNSFESQEEMDAAYERTLEFLSVTPDSGSCADTWPAEEPYTIQDQEAGRVGCAELGGQALIMSWTDTRLLISGYAEGFGVDQAEFYEWWANDSGPI